MTRRILLFMFFYPGCRRASSPLDQLLPRSLGEGWKLEATSVLPAEDAPAMVRQLGLARALQATYEGPAEVHLTLYEMTSAAGAFELEQKQRPTKSTVPFHHDRLFVVVESPGLSKPAMLAFVRVLEQHLKAQPH